MKVINSAEGQPMDFTKIDIQMANKHRKMLTLNHNQGIPIKPK